MVCESSREFKCPLYSFPFPCFNFIVQIDSITSYQSTFQENEITWTLLNVEMTRELTIPSRLDMSQTNFATTVFEAK